MVRAAAVLDELNRARLFELSKGELLPSVLMALAERCAYEAEAHASQPRVRDQWLAAYQHVQRASTMITELPFLGD
jgi:hypothetical protein